MHQFPEESGRPGRCHSDHPVAGFRSGEMVTHWADSANPRRNLNHFKERSPFAKFFKPSPLIYMKISPIHFPFAVQVNGDFGMALDSCHGLDRNLLHDAILLCDQVL
jgi:hypothetical protein